MAYLLLFLEGVITFISPCMLPMLPIYVSYFAGGAGEKNKAGAFYNSIGFVIGFTVVFVILGAFAATAGIFLNQHKTLVNIISGAIVVVFGLNYLGILNLLLLNKTVKKDIKIKEMNFFTSILFGIVFAVGWSPCVGAFLGSALMIAAQGGSALRGSLMLLIYSLGLGLPFIICALLIDELKWAIGFIKRHYRIINMASGALLVIVGIFIMTGHMGYFLSLLTF